MCEAGSTTGNALREAFLGRGDGKRRGGEEHLAEQSRSEHEEERVGVRARVEIPSWGRGDCHPSILYSPQTGNWSRLLLHDCCQRNAWQMC